MFKTNIENAGLSEFIELFRITPLMSNGKPQFHCCLLMAFMIIAMLPEISGIFQLG
jgi:hypothetical protein